MLYFLLVVVSSTAIIVMFRLFERFRINKLQAITVNYLVAAVFGYLNGLDEFKGMHVYEFSWFPVSIIVGFTLIVGFNLFALSAQKAGVVITAIASRMSVVIPVILGFTIFAEIATIQKIVGIILALFAFYLTFKKEKKIKMDRRYFLYPVLLFFALGANDSMLKYAQFHHIDNTFVIFLATAFFMALLLGIIVLAFDLTRNRHRLTIQNIIAGIILGLFNWWSTYYFLKGLNVFDVSVFVPMINVSIVALSTLVGFLIFREKLRLVNWAGIVLAIISIIVIAWN